MLVAHQGDASADQTIRETGEPGVRLRCLLNLRQ
ncbi:DUF6207 family protein [Streptomyces bullii]|uniref:DUF6207 family protein n=1 Tax=Streptomyces bullii TaxID=349910 RepID=A0ABW0V0V4_9ACTN